MNTIAKTQTFAVLGAVLALALMPILVDSAYADADDITSKIQKLEDKITSIQERSENLSLGEIKLINHYKKQQMDYQTFLEKSEQKLQTQKLIKSELKKVQAEEQFLEVIRTVYIENDRDRGIETDNILELTLEKLTDDESWNLIPVGMDKLIKKELDADAKKELIQYKEEIVTLIQEIEEINENPNEVYTLTSDGTVDTTNSEINQIVTPSIITADLQQKIKEKVSNSQNVVKQSKAALKAKQIAAQQWAEQEEQNDPNPPPPPPSEPPAEGDDKKDKKEKTDKDKKDKKDKKSKD